ncbi:aminoglycoside phosphotransferase family protein [Agromyces soli]
MNGSFGTGEAGGAADAPEADVRIDEALAARLVAAQHPDLAGPVRLVANGWDNAILRLGDRLTIRMPRRRLAAGLIANELRWLPELGRRSPVALPVPVRAGRPADGYPFEWSIAPWFDGTAGVGVEPVERSGIATGLAGFIASLQRPAPDGAPRNPYRGVPLIERDPVVAPRLERGRHEGERHDGVRPGGSRSNASAVVDEVADPAALRRIWHRALAAEEWAGPPVWVHGDLHPGNLLLEASGAVGGVGSAVGARDGYALAAVLDFGDLSGGDPAGDLAAAWLCFDGEGRARFRDELDRLGCGFGAADWARARGWALAIGSSIVETVGTDGPIGRVGAHALRELVAR